MFGINKHGLIGMAVVAVVGAYYANKSYRDGSWDARQSTPVNNPPFAFFGGGPTGTTTFPDSTRA